MLVYDNYLDNKNKATRKFGPYVVMSTNDNATYHLAELDGTRIAVPVAGKRIKAFKKQHEEEPNPEYESKDGEPNGSGKDWEVDGLEGGE